jgi:lipopolysaccharide transport system permease protein
VTLSLFLTPIFYPIEAVPPAFRTFMYLNPLTFVVEQSRALLLLGHWPDFAGLAIYSLASVVALAATFWLFQRLRPGFADVL